MRKNNIWFIAVVTLILIVSVLSACNTKKPWDYGNVEWYSETPVIRIIVSSETNNDGLMEIDGEEKPIRLLWGPALSFRLIDATKDDGDTAVEEMTLISGKVKYDKRSATLIIKKDNVFDNQYEKIVLHRKNL